MTCTDPDRRKLLLPYALRRSGEFEQRSFERHLLDCDACHQDLVAVFRSCEVLAEHPHSESAEGPPAQDPARSVRRDVVATTALVVTSAAAGFLLHAFVTRP